MWHISVGKWGFNTGGVFLSFQGFQGAGSYGDLTGPGLRGGGDSQVQEVSDYFFTSESTVK